MAWNIELIVVEPQLSDFNQVGIIDIAVEQAAGLPFWEATSYTSIEDGVAIGNFDGKTILIDPSCRLFDYLANTISELKSHKVVFCRIANNNICKYFSDGKEVKGNVPNLHNQDDKYIDGEVEAWEFLKVNTGLSLIDPPCETSDLNNSTYSHYMLEDNDFL
ncbi:hypothetical protein KCM76_24445 [Zooshikella marina]|uniref:hypothetical protein n=1 Tax=Zooshikella ganghwensis TaxID=202772 RepID=UPI001BB04797|nr:hypothetical protein [Zooshikella ganghwensis]MBU2709168.1 hypothetical protein [Zooshikella ganghwensis]